MLKQLLLVTTILAGGFYPMISHAETLADAVKKARAHHPSVLAAKAGEEAALMDVKQEQSAYFPTISATASAGRLFNDSTTTRGLSVLRGTGYSYVGEGSATLSQTVYDFNARYHGVEAAKARYQAAGANLVSQQSNIALQATQAYLQLLRADILLQKATRHAILMQGFQKRIQTAFDNGGADEAEVSQAQDFVSLAQNALIQFRAEKQIAEASYKEVVGELPESVLSDPAIDLSRLPKEVEQAMAMARGLNSQIDSAALDAQASAAEFHRETTNLLPQLDAEMSYLKRDQKDLVGGETVDARGTLRLSWEYSFGGAQTAAQNRAAALQREAEMNREALERVILRDVEVAWASLELARDQKINETDRVEAARQTYKTYQDQYEGAQRSILEVMTVASALFGAEQAFTTIKYQEMSAAANLLSVMGLPVVAGVEADQSKIVNKKS